MAEKIKTSDELDHRDRNFGGVLLVVIGLTALLLNVTQIDAFGFVFLPGMGLAFLAWGFYTRRFGFTIPGCILTGLGVGLIVSQWLPRLDGPETGGIFILGLAGGFLGIMLVAPYFERKLVWWPVIPAAILGLVGVLLFGGEAGLNALAWLGTLWPGILVVIGLYLLFMHRRREQ